MKILIRAEGGPGIGMGHIMRTLVLADHLRQYAEVYYISIGTEDFLPGIACIKEKGYPVIETGRYGLFDSLDAFGGGCLITDSYDVDEDYFDRTAKMFDYTGYIDDLGHAGLHVDFIINPNIYAPELDYRAGKRTRLFLGTSYALLREEFRRLPKRQTNEAIRHVMITMGGSDPYNLTGEIAGAIHGCFPEICLHAVIGPSFLHKNRWKGKENDWLRLYHNPKMSSVMQQCDLAISACGSTLYELAACGTPAVGIVTAENQKMAAQAMKAEGMIELADSIHDINACIGRMDYQKRYQIAQKGQSMVDGLGGARLAEAIAEIIFHA